MEVVVWGRDLRTVKSPTATRKRTTTARRSPKRQWFKPVFMVFIFAIVVLVGKYTLEQTLLYNPLLGIWRAQTAMGIREIVFEKESMTSFGTKTSVTYDIKEKSVIVMDSSLQVGNLYTIIDKDTISSQMGNYKTMYKRVP